MNGSIFNALLPFWILGFPLVLAIINLISMSRSTDKSRHEHVPRTQPDDRRYGGAKASRPI